MVCSEAVAVNARIWWGLRRMTASVSVLYAGRKSLPHWEITWASSTTRRLMRRFASSLITKRFWRLSGVVTTILVPLSSLENSLHLSSCDWPPRRQMQSIPACRSLEI